VGHQVQGPLEPQPLHEPIQGLPGQALEYAVEVEWGKAGRCSDLLESERLGEVADDVIDRAVDAFDVSDVEAALVLLISSQDMASLASPSSGMLAYRRARVFASSGTRWLEAQEDSRGADVTRVTGIGGVFFQAKDAPALQGWYKRHLGIDVQAWGGATFDWSDADGTRAGGTTVWLIGPEESKPFAPSTASFMVNYRVEDLLALVEALKAEGCNVLDRIDDSEYGKFAWLIDPEGNKVELWEPPAGQ
jgi:predicted enzyme related to lactoylglutathione lyase